MPANWERRHLGNDGLPELTIEPRYLAWYHACHVCLPGISAHQIIGELLHGTTTPRRQPLSHVVHRLSASPPLLIPGSGRIWNYAMPISNFWERVVFGRSPGFIWTQISGKLNKISALRDVGVPAPWYSELNAIP